MKKALCVGLFACVLIVQPVGAIPSLGWFQIDNAYIQHLDGDSYRLRVNVSWGADPWNVHKDWTPEYSVDYSIDGVFNHFRLDPLLGSNQYHETQNAQSVNSSNVPGAWDNWGGVNWGAAALSSYDIVRDEYGFGYDFDFVGDLGDKVNLDYAAQITWAEYLGRWPGPEPVPEEWGTLWREEHFSGQLVANVIPEPTSLMLLIVGLAAVAAASKKHL